ncbi:MAG: hypothetical protein BZ138_07350 [Methanosphaera sp. rholeuAM270]|nr:MAG: hypothetical protein BZ138_07350 [Methanosphaera sp. rholeuAM270]
MDEVIEADELNELRESGAEVVTGDISQRRAGQKKPGADEEPDATYKTTPDFTPSDFFSSSTIRSANTREPVTQRYGASGTRRSSTAQRYLESKKITTRRIDGKNIFSQPPADPSAPPAGTLRTSWLPEKDAEGDGANESTTPSVITAESTVVPTKPDATDKKHKADGKNTTRKTRSQAQTEPEAPKNASGAHKTKKDKTVPEKAASTTKSSDTGKNAAASKSSRSETKKAAASKPAAKKTTVKSATKKTAAKKAESKPASKKAAGKDSTAKSATSKSSATKKPSTKKTTTKDAASKPAAKKTTTKTAAKAATKKGKASTK